MAGKDQRSKSVGDVRCRVCGSKFGTNFQKESQHTCGRCLQDSKSPRQCISCGMNIVNMHSCPSSVRSWYCSICSNASGSGHSDGLRSADSAESYKTCHTKCKMMIETTIQPSQCERTTKFLRHDPASTTTTICREKKMDKLVPERASSVPSERASPTGTVSSSSSSSVGGRGNMYEQAFEVLESALSNDYTLGKNLIISIHQEKEDTKVEKMAQSFVREKKDMQTKNIAIEGSGHQHSKISEILSEGPRKKSLQFYEERSSKAAHEERVAQGSISSKHKDEGSTRLRLQAKEARKFWAAKVVYERSIHTKLPTLD